MEQNVNPFSSSEPLRQVQLYLIGFNLALCTEAGFLLYVVDIYVKRWHNKYVYLTRSIGNPKHANKWLQQLKNPCNVNALYGNCFRKAIPLVTNPCIRQNIHHI
jgi:hypothetical protein